MTNYTTARLYRVVLPRAVCGFFCDRVDGAWRVVEAAPYLRKVSRETEPRAFVAALKRAGAVIEEVEETGLAIITPPVCEATAFRRAFTGKERDDG